MFRTLHAYQKFYPTRSIEKLDKPRDNATRALQSVSRGSQRSDKELEDAGCAEKRLEVVLKERRMTQL